MNDMPEFQYMELHYVLCALHGRLSYLQAQEDDDPRIPQEIKYLISAINKLGLLAQKTADFPH